MADGRRAADIFWVEPKKRGILPLDSFRLSRSLRKVVRSDRFTVTADRAFRQVVAKCAEPTPERPDTWINPQIEAAYADLHARGHAHSIEVWHGDGLVGGLYGVSLGAAFFGESMFSRESNASKVALAWLVARLKVGGYRLLDCQFITDHLSSLGAIEISRDAYVSLLDEALGLGAGAGAGSAEFARLDRLEPGVSGDVTDIVSGPVSGRLISQLLGQTS